MNNEEPSTKMLSVLNDDCIYKILEFLSLDELCACSRTCKRFKGLCNNHFRRKFSNEANQEVKIIIGIDGKLKYEKYVKYFTNFIKNLMINDMYNWFWANVDAGVSTLTNFVKKKCHQNINTISIVGNVKLVPFCKEIEGFLRNVKIVKFGNRSEGTQEEAIFLKYCPEVRKLVLGNLTEDVDVTAILQQTFRQLTHFHIAYTDSMNFNAEQLKMFYENNDKIRCVVWQLKKPSLTAVECIQCVAALHLQYFFVIIDSSLIKRFQEICSHFTVLCARESFKSLEIQFDLGTTAYEVLTSHASQLAKFKQLTKIRVFNIGTDVIPLLRSLVHLKIILLHYLREIPDDSPALPQVEELQILSRLRYTDMKHFARYWPNLKRILLPVCGTFITKFHIAELNRARENLKNACELTIFTDNEDHETILDHKLVKLEVSVDIKNIIISRCYLSVE